MGQVTVTLNGRNYRLHCGDGDEQRLQRMVELVSQKLDSVVMETGQAGQERLLMLTALLLADDLLDAKDGAAARTKSKT